MGKASLAGLRVGVFSGGNSSERSVSLRSGRAVKEALVRSGVSILSVDPRNLSRIQQSLKQLDLAFLALHGKGGEDGAIQRLLDRAHIPYVGSDAEGSRVAFNKVKAKKLFESAGIPTPVWKMVSRKNWRTLKNFPTPFFVKPNEEGSSIGVFLVEDFDQSAEKIGQGIERYGKLLIEERINGREFTVGILGKRALPVVELKPKSRFYDYHAKYTAGMTEYLVPAPVPAAWKKRFQTCALKVHQVLGLRDFSRVDIMADTAGRPFVLEANTIPGFTELSLLPKAAREAGISFKSLCLQLIEMAWQRHQRNGRNGKA